MKKSIILDEIDRKILEKLDENARSTPTQIAVWLGESKQLVSYRIRKMIDRGIIDLVSAIIESANLGYFHCQIYLKLSGSRNTADIMNKLAAIPSLHWEAMSPSYDLIIFFLARTINECLDTYQNILNTFSGQISAKDILISGKTYYLNHRYITGAKPIVSINAVPKKVIELKKRDLDIINSIKENGRIQINNIAKKITLSPFTIKQRIAYLRRKGVIKAFKLRLNDPLLGYKHYMALISLPTKSIRRKEAVIRELISSSASTRIIESIGTWDIEVDFILEKNILPKEWLSKILFKAESPNIRYKIIRIEKVLHVNNMRFS